MTPICPYCNTGVEPEDPNRRFCSTCGVAHHADCWEENGGCTVFGCASAPEDAPKVTVGAADLASPPVAAPPMAPAAPRVPPPPPSPVTDASGLPLPPPPPPPRDRFTDGASNHLSFGGYNRNLPPPTVGQRISVPSKNRATYVLLGVFLGFFGVHNFYAGYTGRAIAQLCITLGTFFFGAFISWIWAIVEVCIVDRDRHNIVMD